jgi:hypothetical protein
VFSVVLIRQALDFEMLFNDENIPNRGDRMDSLVGICVKVRVELWI